MQGSPIAFPLGSELASVLSPSAKTNVREVDLETLETSLEWPFSFQETLQFSPFRNKRNTKIDTYLLSNE